jgi:hypothetical protein
VLAIRVVKSSRRRQLCRVRCCLIYAEARSEEGETGERRNASRKTLCSFRDDDLQTCITKHEAIAIHPSSAKCLRRKSKQQISLKGIHLHHSISLTEQLRLFRPFHILPVNLATVHRKPYCDAHLSGTIPPSALPFTRRLPPLLVFRQYWRHRAFYIDLRAPSGNLRQDLARHARRLSCLTYPVSPCPQVKASSPRASSSCRASYAIRS